MVQLILITYDMDIFEYIRIIFEHVKIKIDAEQHHLSVNWVKQTLAFRKSLKGGACLLQASPLPLLL